MKTLLQKSVVTAAICLFVSLQGNGQSDVPNDNDFNLGLSSTDALNVGLRYGFGQNKIGINVGGDLPAKGFFHVVTSASYYRHLWGKSKHTAVMPWYLKAAAHFNYSESELTPGNFSDTRNAGARIYMGRDLNLSSRLGLSAAIGPILIFFDESYGNQRVKPHGTAGMDLMAFYRLR